MQYLIQLIPCLWCVWPALVVVIGYLVFYVPINSRTYFDALPVGKDPLSPACQDEFETTRLRDRDKRHVIYWCAGIIAVGYVVALLANTLSVSIKSTHPATLTPPPALTQTWTPEAPVFTPTK